MSELKDHRTLLGTRRECDAARALAQQREEEHRLSRTTVAQAHVKPERVEHAGRHAHREPERVDRQHLLPVTRDQVHHAEHGRRE